MRRLTRGFWIAQFTLAILLLTSCTRTSIRFGGDGFFLIPIVAFVVALIVVIRLPPTRGGRRRGLIRRGLVTGVVVTGLYTLLATAATIFDAWYLERLLTWVWIPGIVLYAAIATAIVISRKKA